MFLNFITFVMLSISVKYELTSVWSEVLSPVVNVDELAQALRSIGEPIFGQSVKDISGGRLLKQLFDITEKFNMPTQPQLLLLQ